MLDLLLVVVVSSQRGILTSQPQHLPVSQPSFPHSLASLGLRPAQAIIQAPHLANLRQGGFQLRASVVGLATQTGQVVGVRTELRRGKA